MLLLTKYTVLYKENEICCIILLSLPSRERGLKSKLATAMRQLMSSLPSRERGLKYSNHCIGTQCNSVAPFAGAWIEICLYCRHRRRDQSLPSWEHGCKCRPKSDWHYAESQIVPFFLKIRQFPGFSVKLCTS